jgi:hypothetical protein
MKSTKQVKISLESWQVLKRLSDLSGQDINAIIEMWLYACSKALDSLIQPDRISLYSCQYVRDGKPQSLVNTYLGAIWLGKLPIPIEDEFLKSDVDSEFLKINEDLERKEKLEKKVKRVKVKFSIPMSGAIQTKDGKVKKP